MLKLKFFISSIVYNHFALQTGKSLMELLITNQAYWQQVSNMTAEEHPREAVSFRCKDRKDRGVSRLSNTNFLV